MKIVLLALLLGCLANGLAMGQSSKLSSRDEKFRTILDSVTKTKRSEIPALAASFTSAVDDYWTAYDKAIKSANHESDRFFDENSLSEEISAIVSACRSNEFGGTLIELLGAAQAKDLGSQKNLLGRIIPRTFHDGKAEEDHVLHRFEPERVGAESELAILATYGKRYPKEAKRLLRDATCPIRRWLYLALVNQPDFELQDEALSLLDSKFLSVRCEVVMHASALPKMELQILRIGLRDKSANVRYQALIRCSDHRELIDDIRPLIVDANMEVADEASRVLTHLVSGPGTLSSKERAG